MEDFDILRVLKESIFGLCVVSAAVKLEIISFSLFFHFLISQMKPKTNQHTKQTVSYQHAYADGISAMRMLMGITPQPHHSNNKKPTPKKKRKVTPLTLVPKVYFLFFFFFVISILTPLNPF